MGPTLWLHLGRSIGIVQVMLAEDCDGELLFEIHELAETGAPLEVAAHGHCTCNTVELM